MLAAIRGLPRTVWLVGAISLVNDSASEMLYPLIPLYLGSVLGAGPRALGVIEGVAEAAASLLKLFSGVIVDRTRRSKPWMVAGYGLGGLARPLVALAMSWPVLLALRLMDRVGKGLRASPRDALLAASVPSGSRGLAFGFHRAMDNAGAVIGPLLAAVLLARGFALRDVFVASALPGIVCLGLTLFIQEPEAPPASRAARFEWRLGDLPAPFIRYLGCVAVFTVGNSSNMFLLLRAKELGLTQAMVPTAWAMVSLVAAVLSTPLSALSDRWGRRRFIAAGWLVYAGFYLALGLMSPGRPELVVALFGVYGIFMAATEGVEKALVADLVPQELTGRAFGWFHLTCGALVLPASLVFGWLYERAGAGVAFSFSAASAVVAVVGLGLLVRPGR